MVYQKGMCRTSQKNKGNLTDDRNQAHSEPPRCRILRCDGDHLSPNFAAADSSKPIVALLLKESETPRDETRDRPTFEKQLKESCTTCEFKYWNAGGDVARPLSQVESALTGGATVLVLDPVDANAAGAMVRTAGSRMPRSSAGTR